MRELTITCADRAWHEPFHTFVSTVFPSISFRRWAAHGGWDDSYRVFALLDGNRIVASASLQCMNVILHGRALRGWQLGAVGTDPNYRNRGLQRRIMARLLSHCPGHDLIFLFANDSVLEFYPRFGFERQHEQVFAAQCRVDPSAAPFRALDPESSADRALLARISATAEPAACPFSARSYGSILLWYLCNFHGQSFRYLPEHDSIIVAEQHAQVLHVHDVLGACPLDLAAQLPRLIHAPIARIEFGYGPAPLWPYARPAREYTDSPLFTRGPHSLPNTAFKFPMLAQT